MALYLSHCFSFVCRLYLLIGVALLLNACGNQQPSFSTVHYKIGSDILTFDQMQATDWWPKAKELAYLSQLRPRSAVKLYIGAGKTLDIPYAKSMMLIENSRLSYVTLTSIALSAKSKEQKEEQARQLYQQLIHTLEVHPDWQFNARIGRWLATEPSSTLRLKRSEDSIRVSLHGDYVRVSHHPDNRLPGCLSPITSYQSLFDPEYSDLTFKKRIHLFNLDNDRGKRLLNIMQKENPYTLSIEEYVRRVDRFMTEECPDMLKRYGQFAKNVS